MSTISTNHANIIMRCTALDSRVGTMMQQATDYSSRTRAFRSELDGAVDVAIQELMSRSLDATETACAIAQNLRTFIENCSQGITDLDQNISQNISGGGV